MSLGTKESSRHIEVVLRALDTLDRFERESGFTLRNLIEDTGLTRSRAMRLLGTLESRGYVLFDPRSQRYFPGIRLGVLGRAFERSNPVEVITRPVLRALAEKTGESATFYVIDGTDRLAFAREEGAHTIRYSVAEGQRMPLHAGASGKVLLAYGPSQMRASILSNGPLPAVTPRSITDPDLFRRELEDVRRRGYAVSRGENVPDAYAIAAPVFDHGGQLVGALGIAAPLQRLNDENIEERAGLVLAAASRLSRRFGSDAGTRTRREKPA